MLVLGIRLGKWKRRLFGRLMIVSWGWIPLADIGDGTQANNIDVKIGKYILEFWGWTTAIVPVKIIPSKENDNWA
mgnify:CR=1 FL=1